MAPAGACPSGMHKCVACVEGRRSVFVNRARALLLVLLCCGVCRDAFGWDGAKADDVLKPVLASYGERTTQLRIDQFLAHKQRFAKIRSKRLQQAVTAIVASTGADVNPELFYAATEHLPDLKRGGEGSEAEGGKEGEEGEVSPAE